jgi:hypothetical protein
MSDSNAEKNKATVLKGFETLFSMRDDMAADRFWSPKYIRHSAHIEPWRDGLFNRARGIVVNRSNPQRTAFLAGMIVFGTCGAGGQTSPLRDPSVAQKPLALHNSFLGGSIYGERLCCTNRSFASLADSVNGLASGKYVQDVHGNDIWSGGYYRPHGGHR